ncbi:MAG: hypothetical protein K0U39_01310 [Alphaproteobacteria bacterium]|nr:hypothetical protein [Alphaproteobacteria bacterium]
MSNYITLTHKRQVLLNFGQIYLQLGLDYAYGSAEIYNDAPSDLTDIAVNMNNQPLLQNAPMVAINQHKHHTIIEWRNRLALYRYGHMIKPHHMSKLTLSAALKQIFSGHPVEIGSIPSNLKISQLQPHADDSIDALLDKLAQQTGVIWHSKIDGKLGIWQPSPNSASITAQTALQNPIEMTIQKFLPPPYIHAMARNSQDEWHPTSPSSPSLAKNNGFQRIINNGEKPHHARKIYQFFNPEQVFIAEYGDLIPLLPGAICTPLLADIPSTMLILNAEFYDGQAKKSRFTMIDAKPLTVFNL